MTPRKSREGGTLIEALSARTTWPAPTATMHKGWSAGHNRADSDDRLDYTIEREGGTPGERPMRLNPDWTELLVGWPLGWSELDPLPGGARPAESWPADEWERGVPRVIDGCAHRAARLKAIGNGQVPAVAAMAWRRLTEAA